MTVTDEPEDPFDANARFFEYFVAKGAAQRRLAKRFPAEFEEELTDELAQRGLTNPFTESPGRIPPSRTGQTTTGPRSS